jgi:hypothetical protein
LDQTGRLAGRACPHLIESRIAGDRNSVWRYGELLQAVDIFPVHRSRSIQAAESRTQ